MNWRRPTRRHRRPWPRWLEILDFDPGPIGQVAVRRATARRRLSMDCRCRGAGPCRFRREQQRHPAPMAKPPRCRVHCRARSGPFVVIQRDPPRQLPSHGEQSYASKTPDFRETHDRLPAVGKFCSAVAVRSSLVSPVTDETTRAHAAEIEKALSLLIHDLRTPLVWRWATSAWRTNVSCRPKSQKVLRRDRCARHDVAPLRRCGWFLRITRCTRTAMPPRTLVDRLSGLLGSGRVQHPMACASARAPPSRQRRARAGDRVRREPPQNRATGDATEPITFVVTRRRRTAFV
jgi:hypothetical protein